MVVLVAAAAVRMVLARANWDTRVARYLQHMGQTLGDARQTRVRFRAAMEGGSVWER